MCGIAGIAGGTRSLARRQVESMCRLMTHRGPDEGDVFEAEDVVLGHRRLRILELSPLGRQPMLSPDGQVALVFNGEIYNYQVLRKELTARGHAFRGSSDTEVLLECYRAYGERFLERLRGMFALAVYDRRNQTLLLARDAQGIKPLYVCPRGRSLAFASEVRPLRDAHCSTGNLDEIALGQTLMLESPLDDRTLWSDIRSLPPGSWLKWRQGSLTTGTHWQFPAGTPAASARPAQPLAPDEVRETVRSVVAEHLASDVPLGLLLSGGLDSSALAALVQEVSSQPLRTFTLGFPGSDLDEASYAEQVARRLGTQHTTIPMRVEDFLGDLEHFLAASDLPSTDGLNVYTICKHVRRSGIVVLLSGQGGDEAFGGYATFRRLPKLERLLRWWRRLPGGTRAAGALARLAGSGFGPRAKLAALLEHAPHRAASYLILRSLMVPRVLREVLAPPLYQRVRESTLDAAARLEEEAASRDALTAVSLLESRVYMHNTLLRVSDIYSMAHSLELRVPFADQRICELANRATASQRLRDGEPKPLLLDLVRDQLPAACWRRTKGCFHLPWGRWLTGPLRGRMEQLLTHSRLADESLFQARAWRSLWNQLCTQPDALSLSATMWTAFVLGTWLENQPERARLAA